MRFEQTLVPSLCRLIIRVPTYKCLLGLFLPAIDFVAQGLVRQSVVVCEKTFAPSLCFLGGRQTPLPVGFVALVC